MAIAIYLKTFSVNDSQEQFIEKLHFNMNQLVELGLGKEGPAGAGLRGYPGIQGITGDQGTRGSLWYYGTSLPETESIFPGDHYLHTSEYSIYSRSDASPDAWVKSIDFEDLLNSLVTSDPSTAFVRLTSTADTNDTIIAFKDANESPQPTAAERDALFLFDFDFASLDSSNNVDIIRSGLLNIYADDPTRYAIVVGDGDLLVGTDLPDLADSLKIKTEVKNSYVHAYFNLSYDQLSTEISKSTGFMFRTSERTQYEARMIFGSGTYMADVPGSIPSTDRVAFALKEFGASNHLVIGVNSSDVTFRTDGSPVKFAQAILPATDSIYDLGSSSFSFSTLYADDIKGSVYIGGSGQFAINMEVPVVEGGNDKLYLKGNMWIDGTAARSIYMDARATEGIGYDLTIKAGDAAGNYIGGDLHLYGGDYGTGVSRVQGSNVYIRGGTGGGGDPHGDVIIAEDGGSLSGSLCVGIDAPYDSSYTYALNVNGKSYFTNHVLFFGEINQQITMGNIDRETGKTLTIKAGGATGGNYIGGNLYLKAGDYVSGSSGSSQDGADVYVDGGLGYGSGGYGNVYLSSSGASLKGAVGIGTTNVGTNRLAVSGNSEFVGEMSVGTAVVSRDATLTVTNADATAQPALHLIQDDAGEAFINFEGTAGVNGSIDTTTQGGGSVIGPKAQSSTENAWIFEGMTKIEINGAEYYVPFYSFDAGTIE